MNKNKLTVTNVDFTNKIAIVRVDFNVPILNGKIDDDTRVVESLPTLNHLINQNAKIILLSHLGRINSLADKQSNKFSLKPVGDLLSKLLPNTNVKFHDQCIGTSVKSAVSKMLPGDILLLENTRYCDVDDDGKLIMRESKCDESLASFWASLGDIFVNDAFGTIHRKHASNYGLATKVKESCIGFLVQKELKGLDVLIRCPVSPYIVVMGGAKAADKIGLVRNFLKTADRILLAGGIATSFLYAKGIDVGSSIVDKESIELIKELIALDKEQKMLLPVDFVVNKEFVDKPGTNVDVGQPFLNGLAMDIGEKTCKLFAKEIKNARTLFWNGPPGVFEFSNFQIGTLAIAKAIAEVTEKGGYTLVGGGDSASAIGKFGLKDKVSFISTGGGASLTLLEKNSSPALDVISNKQT